MHLSVVEKIVTILMVFFLPISLSPEKTFSTKKEKKESSKIRMPSLVKKPIVARKTKSVILCHFLSRYILNRPLRIGYVVFLTPSHA
jgi:hypothetical protein